MDIQKAIDWINAFTPTGDEGVDEMALYGFFDDLGEQKRDPGLRQALISVFERYPNADLGSPGPIVHWLEESPIEEHVKLVSTSLRRGATLMTVWMAERCLRSNLAPANWEELIRALKAAPTPPSPEVAEAIAEALKRCQE